MKRGVLWRVAVRIPPSAEEPVVALMEAAFGRSVCLHTDVQAHTTHAVVYLENRRDWTAQKRIQLQRALSQVRRMGLPAGWGRITLTPLRRENWVEAWKRHFRPLEIGRALLLKPSWSRLQPKPGQAVLVLDPGLSFGTGQHPTTRFCLEQIVARRCSGAPRSFLDAGTGSGILALAAARLGYRPVLGFDSDPEAIRIARLNVRANGLSTRIRLRRLDLRRLSRRGLPQYDVVCANLSFGLLVDCRRKLASWLRPNGSLVLAGVLRTEFPAIREIFEDEGLRLVECRCDREWKAGVFTPGTTAV